MSHLFFYCLLFFLLMARQPLAQRIWTGAANDGRWENPINWQGNTLPAPEDDVVLDNSVVPGSYTVTLPLLPAMVAHVLIDPQEGISIELVLPPDNASVPAFSITGPGYGLVINRGGVFRNASGASSGTPLMVADSIRVNNGGKFIHNTPRGHAENMRVLSAAPGTEEGITVFDIPDASTTLSLSGRTYGKLVLSAETRGGPLDYTAAGINGLTVRSDLEIGEGVDFHFNFADTVRVQGNFTQKGGMFDMGNTARNLVLAIQGDLVQGPQALITETGTGIQEILLCGKEDHRVRMEGRMENEIVFAKKGSGSLLLQSPLSLSHRFVLEQGPVFTSSSSALTLLSSCVLETDSLAGGYIEGPVKKEGLTGDAFLFPVGSAGHIRWLRLENATGDFTVQYHRADPYGISQQVGSGLDHISRVEYWSISGEAQAGEGNVVLSFNDPQSGGVTNLADLRVARLSEGIWENAGNAGFRGSPGSNGWVSSVPASGFSADNHYFALASAVGQENPLPISSITLRAREEGEHILFEWSVRGDPAASIMELQGSGDNIHYYTLRKEEGTRGQADFFYSYSPGREQAPENTFTFFRVTATDQDGHIACVSRTIVFNPRYDHPFTIDVPAIAGQELIFRVRAAMRRSMEGSVYNILGVLRKKFDIPVQSNDFLFRTSVQGLPAGVYFLSVGSLYGGMVTHRFIKRGH